MSVDHKVFVACDVSKAIDVYHEVLKKIKELHFEQRRYFIKQYDDFFSIPTFIQSSLVTPYVISHGFEYFNISVGFGNGMRHMFMTHVCSSDYSETYKGDKIIFSIGSGGEHVEIMEAVKNALSPFGDVYERDERITDEFKKVN